METKRHELKFYINHFDYSYLTSVLSTFLNKDRYKEDIGGYHVRSVYFDNKSDNSYYEKISGTETRKKYRVRIYDLSSDVVRLEIKNKFNTIMLKETFFIKSDDVKKLTSGQYDCLLKYNNPITNKIYLSSVRIITGQ